MSKVKNRSSRTALFPTDKSNKRLSEIAQAFSHARILVIGDFILDEFVWGSVERISPEAPVPVVDVERESFVPGGALNVANNIRTLGGEVIPCGVLGRDLHGRMLVKAMRREGIDTRGVIYDDARPTTRKTRVIAHSQQVVRFDRENTCEIDPASTKNIIRFARKMVPDVDVVVMEDYGKGVIHPELLTELLKITRSAKKIVLVDPKEKHFSYYRGATLITPNRKEALSAFKSLMNKQEATVEDAGRGLIDRLELEAVLVTLGEEGMILLEKNNSATRIPTAAKQVYDVSGAGDTVIAMVAMALASGASKREAAMLANIAAGIVVAKIGTATITKRELDSALGLKTRVAELSNQNTVGVK